MTDDSNPKKLLKALRPIMYLSQLMGVTFPSHIQREKLRLIVIYRVIILSLLSLALIREIPTVIFWTRNLKGAHGMLAFIETRLRWLVVLANFLLTAFANKDIINALIKLMNSSLILKRKEYNSILRNQLGIVVFTTLLIVSYNGLGHDVLWLNPYYAWYTSTIYIITEFYLGFSNLQFVTFLIVIRKYFKTLNENLEKCDFKPNTPEKGATVFLIAKDSRQDKVTEIVKFRKIHMNLTSVCYEMNRCFSVQVLLFLVLSLIEITYSLRAVTVYSIKTDSKDTNCWEHKPLLEILLICTWGGYYISSVLQIVCYCEATAIESRRTSAVVHELLNKIDEKDVEMQVFSLQIMNHKIFFTAGKFVVLNYPLINSIIGTITTYLVIIITLSD